MRIIFFIGMVCYISLITGFISLFPCGILNAISSRLKRKCKRGIYICTFAISLMICIGGYVYLFLHPIVTYENMSETLTASNEQRMIEKWHWNKTLPIFASKYYVYDVSDEQYYTVDVSYLFAPEICTYTLGTDGYTILYNGFDF